ncbi:MAG: M13 family metallopeptidase [Pyrinomonadaceae bacterium]
MNFSKRRLAASAALFCLLVLSLAVYAQRNATINHGFDLASLDQSCKPCQDFFQYANGGWIAHNPIPAAYPSWGRFNELAEKNNDKLHEILEAAAKSTTAQAGSNEAKIGAYYASCMDERGIEAMGTTPLAHEFSRIERIASPADLRAETAHLHRIGVNALFDFGADQDFKHSTQVIGEATQGGLGLPDRDYYTNDDARSKTIREEYVKHMTNMLALLGDDRARAASEASTIMGIETALARASMTRIEQRDPNAIYHKMTVAALQQLTPNFSWAAYLKDINAPTVGNVNVAQPLFFKALDKELAGVSVSDWKTYLRWHLIDATASRLSSKFVNEDFNFKGKILTGTTEQLPRWKRCVRSTDRALGEALGQVYVEKNFTPEAKARALNMVHNLEAALKSDLSTLSWMSDATKREATAKLEAFVEKIGYPDRWRDYSTLKIERASYLDNAARATQFEVNRQLNKIGKPVDRYEWGMTPPTVNAYYNPQMNEIVFPAGILQPPFYDPNVDDAINYGGMGAVIGHEMTHGFDDEGRQFDKEGNLKDWWTPVDMKNFEARADCVVKQFDNFKVEDGINEKGKLVVGESIADLGGLTVAYAAFQKSLEGKPRPANIDGFTPEQRFFLGWAQVWAEQARPEYARLLVNTDPHPLSRFRVNGPLSNMPAFARAFGCKQNETMVRAETERCQIW